tara:strand:+ start:984 stop:1292 length:309 start_codon:yes stop_codon:yes gene_type:complete
MSKKYVWDDWEDWGGWTYPFGKKRKITPKAVNWTSTEILQKIKDEYVVKDEVDVSIEETKELSKKERAKQYGKEITKKILEDSSWYDEGGWDEFFKGLSDDG